MAFDIGKIAKGILGTVAPLIGAAVGGPFGAIGAKFAMEALGIDSEVPDAKQQLEERIANPTAEDVIALRKADNDFKVQMADMGIREEQLNVDDRASARGLAIAKGIIPQVILSTVYTIGFFTVMYFFMTGAVKVPEGQEVLFGSLIGILTGAQIQIMNFWFGSSSGSKEKTAKLG